jgi:hypothetical protein
MVWPACSFPSAQAATLLEFLLPLMNCFVNRWFCVVRGPKPPLHCHNWLSFGKFQDTEWFLIPCPRNVSSRLSPTSETCKYTMVPITQTSLERFSTYWYGPFCCVYLGCCAAEFGSPGGTYKLPCIKHQYGPHRKHCVHGFSVVVCLFSNISSIVACISIATIHVFEMLHSCGWFLKLFCHFTVYKNIRN